MKSAEKEKAIALRKAGHSLTYISLQLGVAKSSVSIWVRDVVLDESQRNKLAANSHTTTAIELRRTSRLKAEQIKRDLVVSAARANIKKLSHEQLLLIGTMLYWAEGGKTQRLVRFSNGDPEMIQIMMHFFREVCKVPESKFRGYIHIHHHLDHVIAERYWASVTGIPVGQFFKTYRKPNKSSQNKRNSLPQGVLDIYVLDVKLFLTIRGWAEGIFSAYPKQHFTKLPPL